MAGNDGVPERRAFRSLDDIREVVEQNGGVVTLEMRVIRNAWGAKALGERVRQNITDELRKLGIGFYPTETLRYRKVVPSCQSQLVRLYKQDTPVARLIHAAMQPSNGNDEKLRKAAGRKDAEILKKVREIVGRTG